MRPKNEPWAVSQAVNLRKLFEDRTFSWSDQDLPTRIFRLHILNEDEAGEFWLHYGTGLKLTERKTVTLGNRRKVEHLDYSPRFQDSRPNDGNFPPTAEFFPAQGVLYVIDEVHEFFNARRWADTGEDALH